MVGLKPDPCTCQRLALSLKNGIHFCKKTYDVALAEEPHPQGNGFSSQEMYIGPFTSQARALALSKSLPTHHTLRPTCQQTGTTEKQCPIQRIKSQNYVIACHTQRC